ncbi:ABC transporter ATP-binding protein [Neorhizobium galegae]|uniref:ABC transporter ATP-binding protein n=1 Tax=Neorhizobium galegae TaxID=399 RepID=UPI002101E06A|nr:ABC transporter ATP-binding protein [Neorhizobium galegae]MCQ1854604.1 ABC transporter ATP-binding protein [Neorhizobium galegae]
MTLTQTQTQTAQPLLDVRGLTTNFYTEDGIVRAVRDVSFHVMPGETLGVVGESGCGKSITGLSIMRLVPTPPGRIDGGEVLFDGRDLLKLSANDMRDVRGSSMSMIFQDPMTSLNPVLTIEHQIGETVRRHHGLTRSQARAHAIDLLRRVGIPNAVQRADEYPHQFSGGMRQRVMIAIALSCDPRLVIADEPTTALDVTIQAQILELMKDLQSQHRSGLIMITHSMGVVAGIADRIQVMYAGTIVETATAEELFANPRHPYTVGLMQSIPHLNARDKTPLRPINGLPPGLIDPPDACPFAPRCSYARAACREVRPPLQEVTAGHSSACWFWDEVSRERSASLAGAIA